MNNAQANGGKSQLGDAPLLQLEDEVDLIGDFVKQQPAATATNNNQLTPLLNGFEVNGVNQLTTQVEVSFVEKQKKNQSMILSDVSFSLR